MVTVDMSARIEVERPAGQKGVWIVRPLTYREFIAFTKRADEAQKSPESSTLGLEMQMQICLTAVVGYRIDGKEHAITQEMLEGAGIADIRACFDAVMGISRIDAETAGN